MACGARIDLVPGMALSQAKKFIDSWRTDHRHYSGPPTTPDRGPLGFNLQAVSESFNDGESETEND